MPPHVAVAGDFHGPLSQKGHSAGSKEEGGNR